MEQKQKIFAATIFIIILTLGCRNNEVDAIPITISSKFIGESYQEIFLLKGSDTIYQGLMPYHRWWAQRTLHTYIDDDNEEAVKTGWSCVLLDSINKSNKDFKEQDYSVYEELFAKLAKDENFDNNPKLALDFFLEKLFYKDLFYSNVDDDWRHCEELYRNNLLKINLADSEFNSFGSKYKDTGLDRCQIEELLKMGKEEAKLLPNQFIITPSACILQGKDNHITNKEYFLVEFEESSKGFDLKIELLNKLCYYHWLSL